MEIAQYALTDTDSGTVVKREFYPEESVQSYEMIMLPIPNEEFLPEEPQCKQHSDEVFYREPLWFMLLQKGRISRHVMHVKYKYLYSKCM